MSSRARALCHPDKRDAGRHLCGQCGVRLLIIERAEAREEPLTEMQQDFLAHLPESVSFRRQGSPIALLPAPVAHVHQHAIAINLSEPLEPQLPTACPRCQTTFGFQLDGRMLACRGGLGGCGATFYLVEERAAEVAKLRRTARYGPRALAEEVSR